MYHDIRNLSLHMYHYWGYKDNNELLSSKIDIIDYL
ncbi:unnamed protein product [Spirodela intermedia]|uniref:Uncharacterized protein n=1 Tax=Spirodela intermedia TaxID=51605 RepID=A0A7I8JSJ8_SPIIN|nr:unnamed protein product [Spirodela intermedia]CAA6673160.1 unnamed protein product [Spirodela intermedia]